MSTSSRFLALLLLGALVVFQLPGLASGVDYDGKIAAQLAIMEKYNHYSNPTFDDDKTCAASDKITELILKWAPSPDFLVAPLKKARAKGLSVAQSEDKNLRVYSWDNMSGGTGHSFAAIAQCRIGPAKIVGKDLQPSEAGDLGAFYDKVFSLHTTSGAQIYLLQGTSIGSTIDVGSVVYAFRVKAGKLVTARIFKTKTGLLDSINCSCYDKNGSTRACIEFANNGKTMKVPLNTDTKFTGKYLIYKFDGQNFAYIGTGR